MTKGAWLAAIAFGWASAVSAQGRPEDYARAAQLANRVRNTVFRDVVAPHWLPDEAAFWYRNDLAEGKREFVFVDAAKGTRALAFDHVRMAKTLAQALAKPVDAERLPFDRLTYDAGRTRLRVRVGDRAFDVSLSTYEILPPDAKLKAEIERGLPPGPIDRRTVSNGGLTSVVFVNERAEPIELFWVNSDGQRRSYGKVPPGKESRMSTYDGHVWLVVGKTPLATFEAGPDASRAVVRADLVAPNAGPGPKGKRGPAPGGPRSPDGKWEAFFRDHNLHVRELATGAERALSRDGVADHAYAGPILWAPDSSRVVALRTSAGDDRKVHLVESTPADPRFPKLHTLTYPKPGDKLPVSKPRLFDPAAGEIPVADTLFPNAWSITQTQWLRDSSEFVFLYNERGHRTLRLVAIDAKTGKTRAVIDETAKTFVDYAGKFFLQRLDDSNEWLWMSERSGWNHLYRIEHRTGKATPVTSGEWLVRGVDKVDAKAGRVWFRAGGIRPGQDPYHVHHARVDLDGKNLVVLTAGDGNHKITYSPDGTYFVDVFSRVDLPPITELRRSDDGSLVCALESADVSRLAKTGWRAPERFVAKGRDGVTDIHGIIHRPTNYDPMKKYPVIESIYAGPHGSFVPKEFRAFYRQQEIAELGFIVVQIDGMGTSNRSKAFHDICWKNLGDSGFPDRILWIKAAAAKDPAMDIRRVGIYGGSAGGQSALRALLAHGDFYYVAVSDCGCHDNRIDKVWWNELWMSWPLGPHYAEQSNATNAHKLTGKLLLTVGELDKNVDPTSTMQVVSALVKAGKDFDLLVVPGAGHGVGESPYAARRRQDFFVRHLLNVAPPERNGRNAGGQ